MLFVIAGVMTGEREMSGGHVRSISRSYSGAKRPE
jgi:hypothetical protein